MLLLDHRLAARIERVDAGVTDACVEALGRFRPEIHPARIEVAGGLAFFAGVNSPLSHAIGLGMNGAVNPAEFDRFESFYLDRGIAPSLELCPLADPSLLALLAARGYRPVEFGDVLFREPMTAPPDWDSPSLSVGPARPDEIDDWTQVLARGFADGADPSESMLDLVRAAFDAHGVTPYLARVGGRAAGAGSLAFGDGTASLVGTAVLPEFRGRGVHSAMLGARLGDAIDSGCDLVVMGAQPGSISHRNAERMGLRVAYTRVTFTKATESESPRST